MPKLIAAKARYEMKNLRLKPDNVKNKKAKRKPALMADTKEKPKELTEPEKMASLNPFLLSRA